MQQGVAIAVAFVGLAAVVMLAVLPDGWVRVVTLDELGAWGEVVMPRGGLAEVVMPHARLEHWRLRLHASLAPPFPSEPQAASVYELPPAPSSALSASHCVQLHASCAPYHPINTHAEY